MERLQDPALLLLIFLSTINLALFIGIVVTAFFRDLPGGGRWASTAIDGTYLLAGSLVSLALLEAVESFFQWNAAVTRVRLTEGGWVTFSIFAIRVTSIFEALVMFNLIHRLWRDR